MEPGLLFAALTIILFGSWAVPTKTLKADPIVLAFWLTAGHFILSLIIFLFAAQPVAAKQMVFPLIAGVLWGVGIVAGYVGIKHLGITRAFGIWIPTVIIVSSVWGLLFFGEINLFGPAKLVLTIGALLLLALSGVTVVLSTEKGSKLGNVKLGVLASVAIGVFHGSFFVPLRASSLPIVVTFLPLTIGMLAACGTLVLIRRLRVVHNAFSLFRMVLAGLILGGGNYSALLTVQFLGVSQGYPLTQLGIIVNTLWGALVFKEVRTVRSKLLIILGILIALAGVLLINFARPA